jgi:hypothetical protein
MKKLALVLILLLLPLLQSDAGNKPHIAIKDVIITPKYQNASILVDIEVIVEHDTGYEGWVEVYKDSYKSYIGNRTLNANYTGVEKVLFKNINIGLGKTTIIVWASICASCIPTLGLYCELTDCSSDSYSKTIDANTLIVPTTTIIEKTQTTTLKTTETVTKFINYTVTQVVTEKVTEIKNNTVTETQVIKEEVTPIWAYASLGSFIIMVVLLLVLLVYRGKKEKTPPS